VQVGRFAALLREGSADRTRYVHVGALGVGAAAWQQRQKERCKSA
jgi:hypothetical protein